MFDDIMSKNENKLRYGEFYINEAYKFICTREDGSVVTTNALKNLNKVAKQELDIDFSFHSLRHTHATILLENGYYDPKDLNSLKFE